MNDDRDPSLAQAVQGLALLPHRTSEGRKVGRQAGKHRKQLDSVPIRRCKIYSNQNIKSVIVAQSLVCFVEAMKADWLGFLPFLSCCHLFSRHLLCLAQSHLLSITTAAAVQ